MTSIITPLTAIIFSPLLFGIITKTKALFAGRKGAPLLQVYYDIFKLIKKGVVYSKSTTWIFRASPYIGISALFCISLLIPFGAYRSAISFNGDFILLLSLFGLARFFMILAALDTASAFEGMGASREAFFSMLAEPVLLICFITLAKETGQLSLSGILTDPPVVTSLLVAIAFFIVLLTENSRIPIDDPNTHLELTMIHEVMVLDHSGPEFAAITATASAKLWLFSLITAQLLFPFSKTTGIVAVALTILLTLVVGVLIGTVESIMARLSLNKVPRLLFGAGAFALLAFILSIRGLVQ